MNEGIVNQTSKKAIKNTMIIGFVVRLILLVFILTIGTMISEPYFIADDIKYEEQARAYLQQAGGLIDIRLLDNLLRGYMQPFWTTIMCVSAYLFKTVYAGRFLNIIISVLCINIIYKLTYLLSNSNEKAALTASRLFAYLPVTVFTCCFPIKDIYITFSVFFAFYIFVRVQKSLPVKMHQILICALLLVGTYFARGAVVEIMLLFGGGFFIARFAKNKNYLGLTISTMIAFIAIYLLKDNILTAFSIKIEDYGEDSGLGNGIRFVQINSLREIYKLPFTYFFANLQPIAMSLFSINKSSFWLSIIKQLNISMYPIAIGNFLYNFQKKQNYFFWISTLIMYCVVIVLSLGVFRHYLFLIPVQIINYSLCITEKPNKKQYIYFASFVLVILIIILTVVKGI